jgi:SAM-dependent methyltransferase
MAHQQQFQFIDCISRHYNQFFNAGKVAEIGSLDINGSIRRCFNPDEYIGFDVDQGIGVDIVQQGQLISSSSGYYDVTISAECFEHNPFWVETFSNMLRITKPGGLVIFTCATTGRHEHGTTRTTPNDSPLTTKLGWSYYKNLDANDFLNTFNMFGWFDAFHFLMCPQTFDLYFYGLRSIENDKFNENTYFNCVTLIERELYQLNNTVRIGVWSKSIGWVPR